MALNDSRADATSNSAEVWSFAGREFDESRLELRVNGNPVDLELKPLEILRQLLLHAGEVVTKDQLLDAVWPQLSISEGSLTTAVHKLRQALGDDDSSVVVTVPRVGYRLEATVRMQESRDSAFQTEFILEPGSLIPGREAWRLSHPLEVSPHSQVWLAEHPKTHEVRVFKFASNAERFKALRREVTVFRFLRENLGERADFVRIFEWNFNRPPYFLESEYGGPNLVQWAQNLGGLGKIPLDRRVNIVAQIAEAVAAAHQAGVLHKDLKPANILVTQSAEGRELVKVADFGSASLIDPSRLKELGITSLGFTQTDGEQVSSITGTFLYLAPEIFCGESPSAATDVYAMGVILYQTVIGDFRKPIAPGWESGVADPILKADIAEAVLGNPEQRLKSAAGLAERLNGLTLRRLDHQKLEETQKRRQITQQRRATARAMLPWAALTFLALIALAAGIYLRRKVPAQIPSLNTVAVLPFQNVGGNIEINFLRFALPDEIATILSHSRGITVRLFAATRKYNGENLDLQKLGKEMGVSKIVTGHYLWKGEQLEVTLEALDVDSNNEVWQDTFDAPSTDLMEMQRQISRAVRVALAPALGASASDSDAATRPVNAEAYKLFSQSAALSPDKTPNEEGISLLERAVKLDPGFAQAWLELCSRYYRKAQYYGGGEETMALSTSAAEKALKLDPASIEASFWVVTLRVESGHLLDAYSQAKDLVRRRPDSGYAHSTLGYVLRYAGLMKEAGNECEKAWAMDPHNGNFASCVAVFEQLGNYPRAMDFLQIGNLQTEWYRAHLIQLLVREGKEKEAGEIKPVSVPGLASFAMLQVCAEHRPAQSIADLATAIKPVHDPELDYAFAAHLAYCGKTNDAFPLLKLSIENNHCSYPAIETDPLLANLRSKPQFAEVRKAAIACREAFILDRRKIDASSK